MSAKLYLLTVRGGVGDIILGPHRRLVEVADPIEYIAAVRMRTLQEIVETINNKEVSDDVQAELIRSLRVNLRDTGLTTFPDTPEEQAALFEKWTTEEEPCVLELT